MSLKPHPISIAIKLLNKYKYSTTHIIVYITEHNIRMPFQTSNQE